MKGLGSGENGEFTFLDWLSIFSLVIGLQNLDMNLTQDDKQELQNDLTEKAERMLKEIHEHLESQDKKLTEIIIKLEELKDGGTRNNE